MYDSKKNIFSIIVDKWMIEQLAFLANDENATGVRTFHIVESLLSKLLWVKKCKKMSQQTLKGWQKYWGFLARVACGSRECCCYSIVMLPKTIEIYWFVNSEISPLHRKHVSEMAPLQIRSESEKFHRAWSYLLIYCMNELEISAKVERNPESLF